MKLLRNIISSLLILLFCFFLNVNAFTLKEVDGSGPYPYNFHIIDDNVYAGGHPL
jgi:hypothetical protein